MKSQGISFQTKSGHPGFKFAPIFQREGWFMGSISMAVSSG